MNTLLSPDILLRQIYRNVRDFAIFTTDRDGRVNSWNIGAELIFGYTFAEIEGCHIARIFSPEDIAEGRPEQEMDDAASRGRASDYRWHMRRDGSRFWADGVLTPVRDDKDVLIGFLKILRDITERKLAQDEIRRLATVDVLTGLANRPAFDTRRRELMALSARSGELLLLLLIDLDRFKEVNDMLGHHAGDELLRQVAQRILGLSRASDFVARLGGDEFAFLQFNTAAPTDGGALAGKLLAALARPYLIEGRDVTISASIGIAVCPLDAAAPEELLKKADLALYHAKNDGRNCFHFYTAGLDDAAHRRNTEYAELRRVIAEQALGVDYQPIVEAGSGRTVAMEALLRFPASILSQRPVEHVIDLAMELSLIGALGNWVFRQACRQLRAWRQPGWGELKMCINVCAKELLDPHYLARAEAVLAECQLRPDDIELELTERDAIELERSGSTIISALRQRGFLLSLDDFGTGYSALSYLRVLPVSSLKLDKSFLDDVPALLGANAIAGTVIQLARDLHLRVVAEGVERSEQADFLQRKGCSHFQGFLFSRPLAPDAATAWLSARAAPVH